MLVAACSLAPARAELPLEQLSTTALPVPNSHRLYLSDPSLGHIVDGRIHVIDGEKMRYLGLIGAGFAAATALSNDGQTLFWLLPITAACSVVSGPMWLRHITPPILRLKYEIEVPPRRAQGLNIKALLRQTRDGRFLLVQNATPAATVTVVDLQSHKVSAEIPNSGCWGVIPGRKRSRSSPACVATAPSPHSSWMPVEAWLRAATVCDSLTRVTTRFLCITRW